MCGRFVSSNSPAALADFFGADAPEHVLDDSYNVAPTNDVYGVVADGTGHRSIEIFRWGLVPSWAKDVSIGSRMINARSETVAEKPSFRRSFAKRRLLIPMSGFYEWRPGTSPRAQKTPMYIHRLDGQPLAAAGLWAAWHDPSTPDGVWLQTCTVLTTGANALMSSVHDRMPVLLEREEWHEWLDPTNDDVDSLQHLLGPAPEGLLTMHAVGRAVNKVQHKGRELIEPVADTE